jgi:diacylglycerol kinase (ATP)
MTPTTPSAASGDDRVAMPATLQGSALPANEQYDRIAVIINPAAGQDRPMLGVMNTAFHAAGVDWEVFVTKKGGDATRYAREAVASGFPVVGVYGGDGTVGEVASALMGTSVPMAIFPGGTANVMSVELGIPSDLAEACALAFNGAGKVRHVDMGQIGQRYFLLRAGIGFEAEMVEGADREMKERFGTLAYALSAFQALREPAVARYTLTLDGVERVTEGMTCIVANAGSIGRGALTLAPAISVSDGLLDVIVVRHSDLPSLLSVAASVLTGTESAEPLQHWQAREISIMVEPAQPITVDGEVPENPQDTTNEICMRVIPGALQVVVPVQSEPAQRW